MENGDFELPGPSALAGKLHPGLLRSHSDGGEAKCLGFWATIAGRGSHIDSHIIRWFLCFLRGYRVNNCQLDGGFLIADLYPVQIIQFE